ncbi:hypothetical protein [Desulfobacterium sp. N47]|uniref:DUF8180 domain-containing protein n=1 Tax=uncultured Desulfobacterium sp. TaxID=201089 RepID=E1YCE7_9BACT|nr:hypothetical protein N47_G35650 [uncultured Desulfobacterium sp.]
MTHDHSHHHDNHHHHNSHDVFSEMSFDEKMVKLLEHWIKHNTDHSETYKDWAKKVKSNDMDEVNLLLNEAAEITLKINDIFDKALKVIKANK